MHKQLTPEEHLIQFFITEFNNSKTNEISISKADLSNINLSEQEITRYIHLMQQEGLIEIKRKSTHNDFSISWQIALDSKCVHYFENKQTMQKQNRNNWIQFWIPVTISIAAIITAILK